MVNEDFTKPLKFHWFVYNYWIICTWIFIHKFENVLIRCTWLLIINIVSEMCMKFQLNIIRNQLPVLHALTDHQ